MKKKHHIKQLIAQGEGQQLDFKFEISDAPKIARSLVAFANTDGGKLLIGVKDNGNIAGVRSEEEFYMIDNAAKRFCQPEVNFSSKEWNIDGKKVLEIIIPKSDKKPHKAPDNKGKYKAFIRKDDQNLLTSSILFKVWKKEKSNNNIEITYGQTERDLIKLIDENENCEFNFIYKNMGLNKFDLEDLLSDFIVIGIIEMNQTSEATLFSLKVDGGI